MTVNQNISQPRNINRLPSGYEGNNIPDDFHIPSVGIEDVDRALFNAFEKDIGFQVTSKNETEKVHVVFAGNERFTRTKNSPIRDKNGAIILPIIAIRRTDISHSALEFGGRGLGQTTGDLMIKKRLSKKDPKYQSIVNKALLKNQENASTINNFLETTEPQNAKSGKFATRRVGANSIKQHPTGKLLDPDLGNNIFEVITMPFPEFFVANYEVTFWTQYIQHMNQMVERFLGAFLYQVNSLRIETDKGYWFVAYFDDNINSKDNFEDYAENEKIIRYSFNVKVTGYLVAPSNSGDMSPFRRYLSAPQVAFGIDFAEGCPASPQEGSPAGSGDVDKFVLSDVQELNKSGDPVLSERTSTKFATNLVRDPFTGDEREVLVQVVDRNRRSGETVGNSRLIKRVEDVIF